MKKNIIIILCFSVVITACFPEEYQKREVYIKACVDQKIVAFDNQKMCPDTGDVKEYLFQGKQIYVFNPGDCGADMTSEVIDSQCNTLGFLGSITGNTKINNEDFSNAVYVRTIWARNKQVKYEEQKESERLVLENEYKSIVALVSTTTCNDPLLWSFTAIGSKACGGPDGYIAFPKEIASSFVERVQKYNSEKENFNKRWSVISDCAYALPPSRVDCKDGKPELVY